MFDTVIVVDCPPKMRSRLVGVSDAGEHPLRDKYNLVYFLVILVGFGVLMPWNVFITIAPDFYVNYWFKYMGVETFYSRNFMGFLTIASQLPNAAVNVINLFLVLPGPMIYRVFAPVWFNICAFAYILFMVVSQEPAVYLMSHMFWITLVLAMLINISNGFYENSVYAVFADFPQKYIGALLIGNNICGLLITSLKIGVTLSIENEPKLVAATYFAISLFILLCCALALFIITKQDIYHFYHQKGIEARTFSGTTSPSFRTYYHTLKSCAVELFNVWFCFATTLTIFPVMMTATKRADTGYLNYILPEDNELYSLISIYLNFNLFSTLGSIIASKLSWPSPKHLTYPIIARAIFVVFFFFNNYRSADRVFPVFFDSVDGFVIGGILMALSHGYFSALAMSCVPSAVRPQHARCAAQLSVCTLMIGLFTGATWAVAIENFVNIAIF